MALWWQGGADCIAQVPHIRSTVCVGRGASPTGDLLTRVKGSVAEMAMEEGHNPKCHTRRSQLGQLFSCWNHLEFF